MSAWPLSSPPWQALPPGGGAWSWPAGAACSSRLPRGMQQVWMQPIDAGRLRILICVPDLLLFLCLQKLVLAVSQELDPV